MNAWVEGLGKFFTSFKLTIEWYLAALFILVVGSMAGATLLWTNVGHIFKIPDFEQHEYRIFCTGLCLLFGVGYSRWRNAKRKKETQAIEAQLIEELMGLWAPEKDVLRQCVMSGSRTYSAHSQDEAAIALHHKGLLLREREYGSNMSVIHTIPLVI